MCIRGSRASETHTVHGWPLGVGIHYTYGVHFLALLYSGKHMYNAWVAFRHDDVAHLLECLYHRSRGV